MFKAMTCAVLLLFALFGHRDVGFATEFHGVDGPRLTLPIPWVDKEPDKWNLTGAFFTTAKSGQASGDKKYDKLEEELKALIEEMKRLEKDAREKVQKDILPQIKREMEKLREKLRQWRDEEDESEPTQVETIET